MGRKQEQIHTITSGSVTQHLLSIEFGRGGGGGGGGSNGAGGVPSRHPALGEFKKLAVINSIPMKNLFGKIASVGRWPGGVQLSFLGELHPWGRWPGECNFFGEGDVGGMAGVALFNQCEWRVWITSQPLRSLHCRRPWSSS